ncbi:MAG: hypothetical protein V4721_06685 [Bacteroidota bacterium]
MIQSILNGIGLCIGIAGTFIMYFFTPKEDSSTYLYTDDEMEEMRQRDKSNSTKVRFGMFLLLISFLFQLAALCFKS